MRYIIAKVSNDTDIMMGIFGGSSEKLKFETKEYYNTPEEAEKAISEKYQKDMDEQADKTWNSASDEQQKDWDKKMRNENNVLHTNTYLVIPIQSVVRINGIPKYLRDVKKAK